MSISLREDKPGQNRVTPEKPPQVIPDAEHFGSQSENARD